MRLQESCIKAEPLEVGPEDARLRLAPGQPAAAAPRVAVAAGDAAGPGLLAVRVEGVVQRRREVGHAQAGQLQQRQAAVQHGAAAHAVHELGPGHARHTEAVLLKGQAQQLVCMCMCMRRKGGCAVKGGKGEGGRRVETADGAAFLGGWRAVRARVDEGWGICAHCM